MRTVWKYPVPIDDRARVVMKQNATILHIDDQGNDYTLYLWALVDTSEKDIERFFRVDGTGYRMDNLRESQKFIGTVINPRLNLVWHVWTD